jgi:large repetitive protein
MSRSRHRAPGAFRSRRPRLFPPSRRGRAIAGGLATVLAMAVLPLALPTITPALAAGTVLFDQPFHNNTPDGTGAVVLPALASGGTNAACLTARGNNVTGGLHSCPSSTDSQGSGTLRLTDTALSQTGGLFGSASVPTSQGLDVTFNAYQYGGTHADGLAFVVAAVDPASPTAPATLGQTGGALGYSSTKSLPGLVNGYLGIGFDVFGNYSTTTYEGSGCTDPGYISSSGSVPGQVVVRGPGRGTVGYCAIASTATNTSSPALALRANSRNQSEVPVELVINPTGSSITTTSGLVVAAGTYKVVFTPVGGTARTLGGTLPTVPAGLYPSSTWTTSGGIPRQLAFGWVGSTGSVTDYHEIDNAKVVTFNPVPQLGVSAVSYNGTAPVAGGPVTYTVTPSVAAGADETAPISVTETLPAGVVPAGAFGTGWVCQAPAGQKITCTNSNTPFANGTSLNPITVVGIVTASGVTPTTIQTGTTSTASSNDANPGIATTTTAGTLPTTPSAITVSPATGSISGGGAVTVGGTNIAGATAIEIGTTAEQLAGTPVTLLPCPTGVTVGCFTVNGNGTLAIASMPARASAATVTVTVVTNGVAAAATYVYAASPAAPAAPTATAGITSATVTWVAPANNGSAITGYVVTPYKAGVAQTPVPFDASTTTRTLTGLTAGSSYTFTVAAVNLFGTGTASPASAAVTPYALPAAPTITAVSAGTSAATLSWSAPAANGSAITGYVVTPYVGGVAQAPQTFASTATTQTVTGLTGGTTYTFTVAAQNAAGTGPASAASEAVTINVSPSLPFPAPPAGEVGAAYSDQLAVTGGTAPYTWSVSAGSLPPGVTLGASSGLLAGTPTVAGSYPFTVLVTDASGQTASRAVTLTVAAALAMAVPAPPGGEVGIAYSYPLTRTGGVAPYTWSVTAGSLPGGVTLDGATGLLSGMPSAAGAFSATVRVTDALGQNVTRTVSVTVAARPALSFPPPPSGQIGLPYSNQLAVTGGTGPFGWSVSAGTLPPGMSLAAGTGLLSGTPTTAGSYPFTVTVVDAFGVTASQAVTLTVEPGPLVIVQSADTSTTSPGARVRYTVTITNTSAAVFSGVTVTDPLSGLLDDATYAGDAAATAGTVGVAAGTLTWTGTLAANTGVTVTFSVVVANPDLGDHLLTNAVTSPTLGTTCPAGGTDPRCATTVTVAGLTIVASADTATTTPGSTVHYTVSITNSGQTPFAAAAVTVPLAGVTDDATYNGDATATAGSVAAAPSALTWTGPLAVGASATVTYSVTVNDPDTGDRSLATTVTSATPGSTCPAGGTDPRCTTTVTVLIPGLTMTVTADTATTTPGGTVHYTVTIANSGQTPQTGVSVATSLAQVLPDSTYNDDAAATAGTVGYAAPALTWTGSLAAGASATVTYSVTVNDPDLGGKRMVTTVTSAAPGSTCPAGGTDPGCSAIVTVLVPGLTIVTSADTSSAIQGATVHYTVTVTNSGQTAQAGLTVTESLAGVLDDAVYNGDAAATAGGLAYAAPVLTWTGGLAAGGAATITYSVTVRNPDPGDGLVTATTTSTGTGGNCPAGGTDPRCAATVRLTRLALAQHYTETTTTPGAVVRLTATFTNTGQTAYQGITVSSATADAVDDLIPNGDQTATSGVLVLSATVITWTGNIPVGGVVTITGTLTVKNPDTGNRVANGTLVTAAAGSNCPAGGTDPACTATVTVLVPGLTVAIAADASSAVPGQQVGYTATLTNSGQTPYVGASAAVTLKLLDDATYDGDAAASAGAVSYTSPVITWTGDVAVGATVTITYSVTVNNPDTGDKLLATTVASDETGSSCPTDSGNPACTSTIGVLTPAVTIIKTADRATAVPGGVVTWTITVANTGQTPYPTVSLTDALGGVLDDAAYGGDATATAGTVSYAAPTLTWTGPLALGATVTITYTTVVNNPDTGDAALTDSVTSTTAGANCAAGSLDTRCSATVAVTSVTSLTFTKTADVTSTVAGDVVHYTITAANSALSPYPGATFTDHLADVLDDASYDADASATTGTVSYSSPDLSWSGTVPAGGTATITYSVTVARPDTGNGILRNALTSASPLANCAAGGTDPRCSTTVTVTSLTLTVSANVASATPGSLVGITATYANTGHTPLEGISVVGDASGLFDDANGNGDTNVTSGTLSIGQAGLVWTGDIPVGATVTLTTSVTVNDPDNGNRSLGLVLSSNVPGNNCPPGGTDPRCTLATPVLIPALTVTNTADRTAVVPGGTVAYTVVVADTGQTPYTGATVTSSLAGVLDDATYNGNVAATAGTATIAGSALTWSGDLNAGATVTITYSVTALTSGGGDKLLTNSVTSSDTGSTCPPASGNAACTASVVVLTPLLTIAASASAASTVPGGAVTYTVTVTNAGQVPFAAATFAADLSGVLDDATYANDGSATVGTASFTSPTLTWTGPLAPGASATVHWSVTVRSPDPGNRLLAFTLTSTTAGSNCAAGSGDAGCSTAVPVAVLTITNTSDVSTTTPGGIMNFALTITNTGQTPYTGITVGVTVADVFDDATYNGDALTSAGSIVFNPDTFELTWTGDLAVGASAVVAGSDTVNNPDTGNRTLTSVASSAAPGSTCPVGAPGPGCTLTVTVLVPAVTIATTADRTTTTPGGTVRFTVTIHNTGQVDYDGTEVDDDLTNVLTDATYNGDATATAGAVGYTAPTLTWTGDLAVGATVTVTFTATVLNPDPGDKNMTNVVSSDAAGSTCPPEGTDPACAVSVTVLVPALSIVTSVDATTVTAGAVVHYTVALANTGQTPYDGVAVTDSLAGVLDDATYSGGAVATAGVVTYTAPTLTWTGDLAVGASATVTFSVTTLLPDPGDHTLSAVAAATAPGSSCPPAGGGPACATTVTVLIPAFGIALTADQTGVVAGGTVHYTIVLTNPGETPFTAATVTDSLAGVLDDGTYGADASASAGSVALAGSDLVWTGDLAVGATVVITFSVTVSNPDPGDSVLRSVVTSDAAGSTCPPGGTGPACSNSITVTAQAIALTGLTSGFTLSGTPGATVRQRAAVTMTVTTNSPTGYTVTVQAGAPDLVPQTPGNPDLIPIAALRVRESGTTAYAPLSAPVRVHTQQSASSPAGDAISNDYTMTIPFVRSDTYTATLTYIAATQ